MKANMPLRVDLRTDKSGDAELRLTQNGSDVDSHYNLKLNCGGDGAINPVLKDNGIIVMASGDYPPCLLPESVPGSRNKEFEFSTKEVIEHGVASANTCGNVAASPKPGEIILFVRPRNHQEKKQDCRAGELPLFCWWP